MTEPLIRAAIACRPRDAEVAPDTGKWVLTMRRELPHPPEVVWPMLTEPDRLARWSPVVPDRPLDTTGPATSRETPDAVPVDAEVLTCDPPRKLVHRWGGDVLHWTLESTNEGCRLTLEHVFADRAQHPSFSAGWHICLAVLEVVLDGHDVERVVGDRALAYGWRELNVEYAA
jgi:uncharacterized protein YndB with AHSA1/START domain